jgi:hypothetical protein
MADVIQLTAALSGDNTPEQPEKIIPQFSKITLENASFAYNFPAYSYTIIRIMKNGTSVNSANEERITVSGSKGGVNINCNNPFLNAKVNIFSLLGENLYNKLLTKNNDFLALSSGAYIIKVTDSGFQKTQKIVVL